MKIHKIKLKSVENECEEGLFWREEGPDLMTWQSVENEGEEGLFWSKSVI
jgi:hypothetical protein